jgi:plastocyanin
MRTRLLAPLLLATLLSACAAKPGATTDAVGTIDMHHLVFQTDEHRIPVGGTITFANTASRALHVLVVGKDAQPRSEAGAPSFGGASGHRAEVGDRWTTPKWNTAGTFFVTCTLHPSMNLKVVVG